MSRFADDRRRQPDHLDREDRRAGDQPRPATDRRGADGPEPAVFAAIAKPVGKRLANGEAPDVSDPGGGDGRDRAANRAQQDGLVDLGGRVGEGQLATDGEVITGQPTGSARPDRRQKRRVFAVDHRSVERGRARVVMLDQARGGFERGIGGKGGDPGFGPAGQGLARIFEERDDLPPGRLQADPPDRRNVEERT